MEHYFTNTSNLKSEIRTIDYQYSDFVLSFSSDNGVFSKDKPDYGSRLLIENFLKHIDKKGNILDVGCGYGLIGITLAKVLDTHVDMCDVNKRAVHLTRMNIKKNKVDGNVFESNVYEHVIDTYDYIVTNPPIRAGKDIVLQILEGANNYLHPEGELWFVIRKDQGAKSTMKQVGKKFTCDVVEKSKGFYIIRAKKSLTRG